MGEYQDWKCNNCGYELTLGGLYEYYIDDNGDRQSYGHPAPTSEDAFKHGRHGFTVTAYCPTCHVKRSEVKIFNSIPVINWRLGFDRETPNNTYTRIEHPKCSVCNSVLIENKDMNDSIICPKCKKGTFEKGDHMIT